MAAAFKLTPRQQRLILLGVGGTLGFLGWLIFFFLPLQGRLSEIRAQVASLRQQLEETRQGLKSLPGMEEELSHVQAKYEMPAATARPEDQVPELLKAVAQMARNAQAQLLEATPKANLGTQTETPSGFVALEHFTPGPSGYLELPIEIQVSGGYHQLGQFLDQIENSKYLVRVKELEVFPDEQDLWHHKAVILLQAYLVPGSKK